MTLRDTAVQIAKSHPALESVARSVHGAALASSFSLRAKYPALARANTNRLTIAVTAFCNYRCQGCRYGRDFMVGEQLSYEKIDEILVDARAAGIHAVRLYGGEPLLHPKLPEVVARCVELGIWPYVTTNGYLLNRKMDALYAAGLRAITIGYYGSHEAYDAYVGKPGAYLQFVENLRQLRERYGRSIDLQLNMLITRKNCSIEMVKETIDLANRFGCAIQVDLVHYSLPYFTEGPERELQFTEGDEALVAPVAAYVLQEKLRNPRLFRDSTRAIAAIPEWLIKGPDTKVPCDASEMIWIGADGSVRLCYAAFDLGNLHQQRLKDILFSNAHHEVARGALKLDCPNCHCQRTSRIEKHFPSRKRYNALLKT